jgi:hypothetical protein
MSQENVEIVLGQWDACPKSGDRRNNQPYYSDIIFYPGTNISAATKERSRDKSLSPFCAH